MLEAGPRDTILVTKWIQWKIHMPAALTYNLCDDKYEATGSLKNPPFDISP